MTTDTAIAILDNHCQTWRETSDGWLDVLEVASRTLPNGKWEDASMWMPVPTTQRALYLWLGY